MQSQFDAGISTSSDGLDGAHHRLGFAAGRLLAVALIVLEVLSACGGGSGPAQESQPAAITTPTVKITSSVDVSLRVPGSLPLPTAMTTVEAQPIGVAVTAPAATDSLAFALDAGDNIALATTSSNGSAVFTAESTVLTFGSMALTQAFAAATKDDLRNALRNADGYGALADDIAGAVRSGRNPLDQTVVQQGFDRMLASALTALTNAQKAASVRPLAVAPVRVEQGYEPAVFDTPLYKVSIANQSSGEPSLSSNVYLRNTSTVFFKAALLDVTGAQRTSQDLKGAGPAINPLNSATPLKVGKPFAGSFSVRLLLDDENNQLEMIKGAIGLFPFVPKTCASSLAKVASKTIAEVSYGKAPLVWLTNLLLSTSAKTLTDCVSLGFTYDNAVKVIKAYDKVIKLVGFTRMAAEIAQTPDAIADTGVCLSEGQYLMNCVSTIEASAINPMMPGAVQPITIQFLDASGRKTLGPPSGLDLQYAMPGLFSLSDTMTEVIARTVEGVGDVTIVDPATETKTKVRVTVTNGKLDKSAYSAPVDGTVAVRLVDAASGLDVYRNGATFDIHLADSAYGRFGASDPRLGGLYFQSAGPVTLAAQPILLRGRDSGSTLSVESVGKFLAGSATCKILCAPGGGLFACRNFRVDYNWTVEASIGASVVVRDSLGYGYAKNVDCGAWTFRAHDAGVEGVCTRVEGQPAQTVVSGSGVGGWGDSTTPTGVPKALAGWIGLWETGRHSVDASLGLICQ